MHTALVWSLRAAWASLPLVAGPTFAAALEDTSRPVQVVGSIGLWSGWVTGLLLTLLPTTTTLTLLRTLAPAVPMAAAVAFVRQGDAGAGFALAVALGAAVLAFTAEVGHVFVQGSAYGLEQRFPLRPPGPLVLGPLEVLWAVTVGAIGTGGLCLAARGWVPGTILTTLGLGLGVPVVRRFHALSRRWVVLVPTGVVFHDQLVLAETALVRRQQITELALALRGTTATDLTGGALGMAVELRFAKPHTFVLTRRPRQAGEPVQADAVLVSPSRPGALVQAAMAPPRTSSSAGS